MTVRPNRKVVKPELTQRGPQLPQGLEPRPTGAELNT